MRLPDGYNPSSHIRAESRHNGYVTRNENLGACGGYGRPFPQPSAGADGYCAKLHKAIYGLKQSQWEWYARLISFLAGKLGYLKCYFDPYVFIHPTRQLILAVYVDDISVFGQ